MLISDDSVLLPTNSLLLSVTKQVPVNMRVMQYTISFCFFLLLKAKAINQLTLLENLVHSPYRSHQFQYLKPHQNRPRGRKLSCTENWQGRSRWDSPTHANHSTDQTEDKIYNTLKIPKRQIAIWGNSLFKVFLSSLSLLSHSLTHTVSLTHTYNYSFHIVYIFPCQLRRGYIFSTGDLSSPSTSTHLFISPTQDNPQV